MVAIGGVHNVGLGFRFREEIDVGTVALAFQNPPSRVHVGGYVEVVLLVGKHARGPVFGA